jgi:phosphate-selective porin
MLSRRVVFMIGAVTSAIAVSSLSWGAEQTVEERLELLEAEVLDLREQSESAGALSAVRIGGYGELHYNSLEGRGGASDKDEIDFHRFVLLFGYSFSDRIRLTSEIELEHALSGDGKPGEVELEQAYIEIDISDNHRVQAGLFLLPVGVLNPNHEPPRFYGVERNPVEKSILPTTWWETGIGAAGDLGGGVHYAAAIHSGLNTSTSSNYSVRSGRQKGAKAEAEDAAATLALGWSGSGVSVGGTIQYQSDVTQGRDVDAGSAWLGEVHADVRRGPFQVRALYAEWELDGHGPVMLGADSQYGWYVEPSVRPIPEWGAFVRYSGWDNQAGDTSSDSKKSQWNTGINWWPHDQVVFKADYQWQDHTNGKEQNGINLGVGYDF